MNVIGAESEANGICVTLVLEKMKVNGTSHSSGFDGMAAVYDHHLGIFYIPKDSNAVKKRILNVSSDVYPFLSHYTYNSFASSINVLMLSYLELERKNGLAKEEAALCGQLFFRLDEEQLSPSINWLMENSIVTSHDVDRNSDSGMYKGIPIKMFTNNNGLTTVIMETYLHSRVSSSLGHLSIVQLDDDGKVLWGSVLPNGQYIKYSASYAKELAKKEQHLHLFGDLPSEVYQRQFCSVNAYSYKNNFFIVLNDRSVFSADSLNTIGYSIDFMASDAYYYKIDRQKNITKKTLFAAPAPNEYRSSFIEGADFDEQRGMYATLVRYKKNDDVSLRMAWARLE